MTTYNIVQLRDIWVRNGGAPVNAIIAVAVSLAESGGRSDDISPSSDYGLWQINSIHFGSHTINDTNWMNVDVNASVAIQLSSNGNNWAPWCTCWQDPADNCGHGNLPVPQPGTPAARQIPTVQAVLGYLAPTYEPSLPTDPIEGMRSAWHGVQNFVGGYARSTTSAYSQYARAIDGLRK
jgi:hypothetical protein